MTTCHESLDGAIVSFLNYGNGQALDLATKGGSANGNGVIGNPYHKTNNQQWKLERAAIDNVRPIYRLQNVQYKTYLDLNNGNTADGTKIQGWEFGGPACAHQLWYLLDVTGKGRVFALQNYGTNTCVDLLNGSSNPETPIQSYATSINFNNPHQLWMLLRLD